MVDQKVVPAGVHAITEDVDTGATVTGSDSRRGIGVIRSEAKRLTRCAVGVAHMDAEPIRKRTYAVKGKE